MTEREAGRNCTVCAARNIIASAQCVCTPSNSPAGWDGTRSRPRKGPYSQRNYAAIIAGGRQGQSIATAGQRKYGADLRSRVDLGCLLADKGGSGVVLKYDSGERRRKHKWEKDYAGFEVEGGLEVGKCPTTVSLELAAQLLNTGVGWTNPNMPSEHPRNIYNVHEGVVYKAAITLAGVSYHGFPCKGQVPREVVTRLTQLAAQKKCSKEFEAWLKRYIQ
jgi:hypothetical protein